MSLEVFRTIFLFFFSKNGNPLVYGFVLNMSCQRGKRHFNVHCQRIKLVYILLKDRKDTACEEAMERCSFLARVSIFAWWIIWSQYFSLLCTLTCSVSNFFSRQRKSINRRDRNYYYFSKNNCTTWTGRTIIRSLLSFFHKLEKNETNFCQ